MDEKSERDTRTFTTKKKYVENCERKAKCSHKSIDRKEEEEETDRMKKQTMPKDWAAATTTATTSRGKKWICTKKK